MSIDKAERETGISTDAEPAAANADDLIDGELVTGGPGEGELIREDKDGKLVAEAVLFATRAMGGPGGEVVSAANQAAGGRLVDTIATVSPGIRAWFGTIGPRQADAHGDLEGSG